MVSYLVSVSTRLVPSRLRIGQVIPDSTNFLNPFNNDHVNHGVEGEGRIGHEGIKEVNPKKTDTIIMFVKPPQFYDVEFSIYINVYKTSRV